VVAAETATSGDRSRALTVLGIVSGNSDEARLALEKALELAGDYPALRMAALNALGYSYSQGGEEERAVVCVEEALEIATAIGDRHRAAALHNHLADLHHGAGRKQEAEESLTEAVKLFAEVEPGAWEPEVWLLTMW
jgi:tetratricopeptide (TPR) repeat protein